jgi:hypothetical protein
VLDEVRRSLGRDEDRRRAVGARGYLGVHVALDLRLD